MEDESPGVSRAVTRDWDKMGFFVTMTGASSHDSFDSRGENRRSRSFMEGHNTVTGAGERRAVCISVCGEQILYHWLV